MTSRDAVTGRIEAAATTSNLKLLEQFVAAWHDRDLPRILGFLDPDIEYHNIPVEPVRGIAATREVLVYFLDRIDDLRWDIRNVAETADGTVLYEKVENFLIDGTWIALEVMATLVFRDGKITHWRGYFDLGRLNREFVRATGSAVEL